MTYSIVARDRASGELGVAVQSHWFSVGPIVPLGPSRGRGRGGWRELLPRIPPEFAPSAQTVLDRTERMSAADEFRSARLCLRRVGSSP